ncbi:MAG TPA: hypothetical protein VFY48_05315 [Solirubrobacterales bacterium]|nr:hypothetical protein [Solirubrobacterales bacterium]
MSDDWRLQVDFRDDGHADAMLDRLDARELEHELSAAFHDRVAVTRNKATVFLYAGDREQAEKARALVEAYARREDEDLGVELTRWHGVADEWRPTGEPLPDEAAERVAEVQARVAGERKESEEQGYPEWEVRIDLPSRGDADEMAERLRAKGLPVVERWRYLLLGAGDESGARDLGELCRAEAPEGSKVTVQGTWRDAFDDLYGNPFAIFR